MNGEGRRGSRDQHNLWVTKGGYGKMGRTGMTEGGWSFSFSRTAFILDKKKRDESMLKCLLLSEVVIGEGMSPGFSGILDYL